ncbi:MAG TPA: Spx/MgsR family RNA polymerase-binding regulatory protein [Wenzhouxiangellaceae bacterium]|nr:Spx/MgsR family RNA polymerase-binding regulatory protein [Wenzhouxiangellaceae bacterium]
MRVDVFGIQSCDTCRKARKWLAGQELDFRWVDLRETAPPRADIERWLSAIGAEALVNRRSTTWRGLDEAERQKLDSAAGIDLLLEYPTLIKRPLFERGDEVRAGFGDVQRQWLLDK